MAATRPTHHLLCIGAHASSEQPFPAANARAIHRLFSGGLGPRRLSAECFDGPRATVAAIAAALDAAKSTTAKYFVFYYSGRFSQGGVRAADGRLDGALFRECLQNVPAKAAIVIFDVAVGAERDDATVPRWARALVEAKAGMRLAAARATRIGGAAQDAGLSRFTSAFVAAMQSSEGDVRFGGAKYVSDKRAIEQTRAILDARWGVTHQPVELGDFGDLPLVLSQSAKSIGAASIDNVEMGAGLSCAISYSVKNRMHVPTTLYWRVETLDGELLGESSTRIVPERSAESGRHRARLPVKIMRPLVRGACPTTIVPIRWRVGLSDVNNRVLDEFALDHAFVVGRTAQSRR